MNSLRTLAAIVALSVTVGWGQTIPERVDAILTGVSGNQWSALVENGNGSVVYYQRDPTNGLAPASNTKLFTTAAAFALLGTNYAFETRVYCDGALSNGVLAGNLNLVCEHDPTWNTSVFTNAREPLEKIAAQLKAHGLRSVSSNVQFYGACALNPGSSDSLAARSPQDWNIEAATAFLAALKNEGIAVSGTAIGQEGFTAPGYSVLHTPFHRPHPGRPAVEPRHCLRSSAQGQPQCHGRSALPAPGLEAGRKRYVCGRHGAGSTVA